MRYLTKKTSSLSLWSRKLEEGGEKCLGKKLYGCIEFFLEVLDWTIGLTVASLKF